MLFEFCTPGKQIRLLFFICLMGKFPMGNLPPETERTSPISGPQSSISKAHHTGARHSSAAFADPTNAWRDLR